MRSNPRLFLHFSQSQAGANCGVTAGVLVSPFHSQVSLVDLLLAHSLAASHYCFDDVTHAASENERRDAGDLSGDRNDGKIDVEVPGICFEKEADSHGEAIALRGRHHRSDEKQLLPGQSDRHGCAPRHSVRR